MDLQIIDDKGQPKSKLPASDALFARVYNEALVHQLVTAYMANGRAGTRKQKGRGEINKSKKKPWRQKGTGRARVGEIRNPLWRKGGTVFGPQPRSYAFDLPTKVRRGALRAALAQKAQAGALVIVDKLEAAEKKTKATAAMLKKLGATGKTLIIDVAPQEDFVLSARNIAGLSLVATNRVTARDVMDTSKIIATRAAIEKLQESLGQ